MKEFKGIITPILTPLYPDESINTDELKRQVERQIAAGIHGVFPLGTNGEGYALDAAEKRLILRTTIDAVHGRVPVFAGTGCIGTAETIRESLMAKDEGADAVSIVAPYFAKASQEELYQHYKTIAAAVSLPVILYNIPARTGNALAPETVGRLSQIENIVAVKDSSGDWNNMQSYLEAVKWRRDFAVFSGNDSLILKVLQHGGKGAIAGCANVYPYVMAEIYNCFMRGEVELAQMHQERIASFRKCFHYGNPNTIVKTAVQILGYPVGKCRAPFNLVPEEGIDAISSVLKKNQSDGMR